jgi:hypothetical protein
MPSLNKSTARDRFSMPLETKGKATTKLHSVMLEAKRIRMEHAAGKLTAEDAADQLAELYSRHRFKSHRISNSLLSA